MLACGTHISLPALDEYCILLLGRTIGSIVGGFGYLCPMMKPKLLILFCSASVCACAQVSPRDSSIFTPLINTFYAVQFPQRNMAGSFGINSDLGGSFLIKNRGNWLYGGSGSFLFGGSVKDSTVIDGIRNEEGFVIDQSGAYADVRLSERGIAFFAHIGKIFPLLAYNPNSGIFLLAGAGFLQHKIRIDHSGGVPQLSGDYLKGYDHLTNGFALSSMLGYRFFGNYRMLNFYFGLEYIAAFTKNRRTYNFDLMGIDDRKRNDQLFGIKLGWTLPLYKRVPLEYYYY
ncbi:MAG: hypothetical protein ACE5DN_02335 [Flavobacteriales bacterium]